MTMVLRQRRPRRRDAGYLAWLRAQPCACCGVWGPCDAAHLRSSSAKYDKPITGMGMRPDDKWALPLKHEHHMQQHAHGDELGWWREKGVPDPFALAQRYYERYAKEHSL